MINKSASRCAVVRFFYHSNDYRPNWTPLRPISITYRNYNKILDSDWSSAALIYCTRHVLVIGELYAFFLSAPGRGFASFG